MFLHIYPLLSALFQAPPATVHGWHLQLLGAAFGTIHEVPFASVAGLAGKSRHGSFKATTWYTIVSSRLQVSIECEVITIIVIYYISIYTYCTVYTIEYNIVYI